MCSNYYLLHRSPIAKAPQKSLLVKSCGVLYPFVVTSLSLRMKVQSL